LAWFGRHRAPRRDLEHAFLDLVLVHWEGLFRYAVRLTGRDHEAEDLVQETITKAFRAFEKVAEDTNYRAWVFTILRNTFLSRARKSGRELPAEEALATAEDTSAPPEGALLRSADGWRHGFEDEVLEALGELPESQRTAVVLCDIEGLSYEEIAHVLGCPVGTVRSRIHHARRRLRAALGGYATARGYRDVQDAR